MHRLLKNGDELSFNGIRLATELRRLQGTVQTITSGGVSPEIELFVKAVVKIEGDLLKALEQLDEALLKLHKAN